MPASNHTPSRRISLRDIAAQAKVSLGSVSSVLNNRQLERRIPPETARKIREVAAKLGYLPNINARRLRNNEQTKNNVIIALVTSFEAPIQLVGHFTRTLQTQILAPRYTLNYTFSLMIEMFTAGKLLELPGLLTGDRFNAAILLNTTAEDDQFLSRTQLPYPAVIVNRLISNLPSVFEERGSGARPAEILVEKKRSHLAVIHGHPLTQSTQNRVESFLHRSAELSGRPAREIIANHLSEEAGYNAMLQYLKTKARCDGLYAVSDALAVGAFRALKEVGQRVPKDVAVIGVGDYEIAPFLEPSLSCVGASQSELAAAASALLFRQLTGKAFSPVISVPILENLRASSGHGPS